MRTGEIELAWGDGQHAFRLAAIGHIRELQAKTGCGPLELLRRYGAGTWRLDDVREAIRIGLIGGGKKPTEATALVERYVDARPLAESVPVAQAVVMVMLYGNEELEDAKQGEQARRGSVSGPMDGSPSPRSTVQVQ